MPAGGQIVGAGDLSVHDRAVPGDGPDRPVAAFDEQCDQPVQTLQVDDRIVSGAHCAQPTPQRGGRDGRRRESRG